MYKILNSAGDRMFIYNKKDIGQGIKVGKKTYLYVENLEDGERLRLDRL